MRVTELTKHNAVRRNMDNNSNELQNLMVGMSSGRRINKPSDDPIGAAIAQDFKTSINQSKTLEQNISFDKVWMSSAEDALRQLSDTMQHVKELALEGANSSATLEFREGVAEEIRTITNDLVKLGNKKHGNLHLFAGTKTLSAPLHQNHEVKPTNAFLNIRSVRSEKAIIPLNQKEPLEGLQAGSFNIVLHPETRQTAAPIEGDEANTTDTKAGNEKPEPIKIRIDLTGDESIQDVVKMINDAAIAEAGHKVNEYSPTGFDGKVYAEIGEGNYTYIEPQDGFTVSFEKVEDKTDQIISTLKVTTTDFLTLMGFPISDPNEDGNEAAELQTTTVELDPTILESRFVGHSSKEYLVKVTRGGVYGKALFIVSDDNGKTWSKTKVLQRSNEIYNPDGLASDKIHLEFGAAGNPFFREGTEFIFEGNQFVEFKGNKNSKNVILDNGIKVALNITGDELFYKQEGDDATVNSFDVLHRLIASLEDDDQQAVMKSIGDIDTSINQILKGRAKVGAVIKELEEAEQRITSDKDFKREELSKVQDLDIAKASIDLNNAELKNKVSLDTSARLIQPTLINFLK